MTEHLRPFQRKFLKGALAPSTLTAGLSMPRGNGKTWLAAHILERCLTPGDALHVAGSEYLLCAASLEQARLCFRFIRPELEPRGGYRFLDASTRLGITHTATNTRLRVLSSNGKTAMGIVGCPLLVADEPGSWEVNGGQLMADAIDTAQGKPGSPMRVIYIGTLAPASDGWWHDLIQGGSRASTYVQMLRGDRDTWDSWQTIRKANPLTAISPAFRAKLREERDAARSDTRLKARFLSYRLNVPTGDEAKMLLDVSEWELAMARQVPEREGAPIVGIDLGAGRAWSAATAVWSNGRTEALALAPGIPEMEEQERRDRVPSGLYQRLAISGRLRVADGLRMPPASALWDAVLQEWGQPVLTLCDRFRIYELLDSVGSSRMEPRVTRWAEAAADIRALRKMVRDGPLSVEQESRNLLTVSMAKARVENDTSGNVRMIKPFNNVARDDVAAALVLAAGAFVRYPGGAEQETEYVSVMT